MLRVIPKIYRPHMIQAAEHVFEAVHTQQTCVAYSFRSYLWRSNARVAVKVLRRRIHPSDWRVTARLLGRPQDALVCTQRSKPSFRKDENLDWLSVVQQQIVASMPLPHGSSELVRITRKLGSTFVVVVQLVWGFVSRSQTKIIG